MAFMGRGGFPSIKNIVNTKMDGFGGFHRGFHDRIHHYMPMSPTYRAIRIVIALIIVIAMAITIIGPHKPTIVDPIESTKTLFINSYLVTLGVLLCIVFLSNSLAKNEKVLIKLFVVILLISITIMSLFFVKKINYDNTYTSIRFGQIYLQQKNEKRANVETNLSLNGKRNIMSSDYYISECMELYKIFSIKVYSIIVIHVFINLLLIYKLINLFKLKKQRDKMNKDDLILFDEEQNIKI